MNPFDSLPFVIPSMNQVRIVELPGLDVPYNWRNKTGLQLLGSAALAQQIRSQTAVLHLPSHLSLPDLIRQFDECFTASDTAVRATAQTIAQEYGRKLALHLLTLLRGDSINRVVRPGWRAEHWAFWAQIRTVYTGGGLMAGHLGAIAAATAQAFIRRHGFPDVTVQVPPHAGELPLYGAARLASPEGRTLVFDFGQTAVKRAIVQPPQLSLLPALPADCSTLSFSHDPAHAAQTRDHILAVVADAWHQATAAGALLTDTVILILACYLLDGHPRPEDWGCYGRLQLLTPHLQTYLSQQISQRLGRPIHAHLLHDGHAAALPFAGQRHTAVITFGTALGIGFPPAG